MTGLNKLRELYQDLFSLDSALSVMNWDRQLMMPKGGGSGRSEQSLRLTKIRHRIATSDAMLTALLQAEKEAETETDLGIVRAARIEFDRGTRLPESLVTRKARIKGEAYDVWRVAKPTNNFALLAPYLEQLFDIARETAEHLEYETHPYDALINLYEEGATYQEARSLFDTLKPRSLALLQAVRESNSSVDDGILIRDWDQNRLREVTGSVVQEIGFDFDRGRLDIAANAFCAGTSAGDVRMTTRPSDHIRGILSSSLHEMGHALYEQNQNPAWTGLPIFGGASLAVHESQSRTWENVIGRSRPFWKFFWPRFATAFPELSSLSSDDFYRTYNRVHPTFVRVGADEVSYNMHILVRFELEVELITQQIRVSDLPEAWNAKYQDYLGITPQSDTEGCLQDVHWSSGSVGYFPTYTMGNLIGVQIWNRLCQDIPSTDSLIASGNFQPILSWLTENLYKLGSLRAPKPLVESLVGAPLSAEPWLTYIEEKVHEVYELAQ